MTELPFGLKGRIFRSPMPIGTYDREGIVFDEYAENNISVVVPLADNDECIEKTGKDLFELYREAGYEIIPLPIEDFATPDEKDLRDQLKKVIDEARAGKNIVVHCSAGIGRTGLFMACLAKTVFRMQGDEAILWVRKYIYGAVETFEQKEFVRNFKPNSL